MSDEHTLGVPPPDQEREHSQADHRYRGPKTLGERYSTVAHPARRRAARCGAEKYVPKTKRVPTNDPPRAVGSILQGAGLLWRLQKVKDGCDVSRFRFGRAAPE
jgi:hypothetical protein